MIPEDWIRSESTGKVVTKPWGHEVWLELNDHYCFKRIYVNAGNKLSFQYHLEKYETSYIVFGEAELWLEHESTGDINRFNLKAGDVYTVIPLMKHRIIAKTDLIIQEVSTPQVHDVIRIEDDTNRPDGFIKNEHT